MWAGDGMSNSTGSTDESVDSAHELQSSFVPSPTDSAPGLTTPEADGVTASQTSPSEPEQQSTIESTDFKDPPPIVRLDGDQLTVIKIEHHRHCSPSPVTKDDSAFSVDIPDLTAVASPITDNLRSPATTHWTYGTVEQDNDEDLVFSRKTKKQKKKKLKPGVHIFLYFV